MHRNKGYIIDTRTPAMSQSERQKGGGYECEINYPGWRRLCKSIDRYHFFLDSYSKLMEACSDMNSSSDKWMTRLTISSWLTHIKEILNCGCLAAQCVDKEQASVVVHGSEGNDVSLAVTALAQIILNPDCRTVRGFEALIEREWIQAGHPFWSRTSKGPFNDSVATKSKSHSPTFTIFLDCVWQIFNQFPCSFEFTQDFLILLADHAYFSEFGTFICDCEHERSLISISEKTCSLWSYLNRPDILTNYINYAYEPNKTVIWPSVAPISLTLWSSMYLRWLADPELTQSRFVAKSRLKEIIDKNKTARLNVTKLRRQLRELIEKAERLGLMSHYSGDDEMEDDYGTPNAEETLVEDSTKCDQLLISNSDVKFQGKATSIDEFREHHFTNTT